MLKFSLGKFTAAESLVTRSLAIYESLEGDHAQQIVDGLNNLGEISRVQDHFGRAESQFRRGLEIARSRLPEDVAMRVGLMNNLAGLYKDLARYDDAAPLLMESLRLRETSGAADPGAIATAHLNLAEVYRLQGRVEEAEPHYARALDIARSTLGPDHPDLAPFVNQSAVMYQEMGQYDRAEPLFREALTMSERSLGRDHPLVAQSLDDFGRLLTARGAFAAAESTLRRALEIRERQLGEDHPDAAVTRIHLAQCLSQNPARGDRAAARELERAIALLGSTTTYPEASLEAYALRAALSERAGNTRGAVTDLATALAIIDTLRVRRGGGDFSRAALLARHLDLYQRRSNARNRPRASGSRMRNHESKSRGRVTDSAKPNASSRLPPPRRLATARHGISSARSRRFRIGIPFGARFLPPTAGRRPARRYPAFSDRKKCCSSITSAPTPRSHSCSSVMEGHPRRRRSWSMPTRPESSGSRRDRSMRRVLSASSRVIQIR